jgi:hypothetical protein
MTEESRFDSLEWKEERVSSLQYADLLYGLLALLSSGYRKLFHQGQSGYGVELTTHLHPQSR